MNRVFVICNQNDQFLEKCGDWGDGSENRAIYRTPHRDEALNQVVELTVKSPDLRARLCEVEKNEKDVLQLPTPETRTDQATQESSASPLDEALSTPMQSDDTPEAEPLTDQGAEQPEPQQILV